MKNTFFLQAEKAQGVKATVVNVLDLFPAGQRPKLSDSVPVVRALFGEGAMDIVFDAMENGTKYVVDYADLGMNQLVCDALYLALQEEVTMLVDSLWAKKSLGKLETMKLCQEVSDAVVDAFYVLKEVDSEKVAAVSAEKKAANNKSKKKEENVQMKNVTIKGVNVTEAEVIKMMKAQGFKMGGAVSTKLGDGKVEGFEAGPNGVLVLVSIGEEVKKLMADRVTPVGKAAVKPAVIPAVVAVSEETSVVTDAIASLLGNEAPWMEDAKEAINNAVQNGEISQEQAFNARENVRDAQRTARTQKEVEAAQTVSQSAAAQRILAMANAKLQGGGASASKEESKSATRRPAANAQTKNQSNGGNVQMAKETQDRPVQGTVAGQSTRRPSGQGAGGAAGKTGTGTGRARLSAGAPTNRRGAGATGGAGQSRGLKLKDNAPRVVFGNGGRWYDNARFTQAVTGEQFEETRKNEALGISYAIFWTPEAYAERFNRDAKEGQLAVLQIFFGEVQFDEYGRAEAGVSIEFQINASTSDNAKSEWYCSNITLIEDKRGNKRWHYTVGTQASKYGVVVEKEKVRMATDEDFKKNKKAVQYVGDGKWTNKRIFGLDISEEVIAQVMRWADFGYAALAEGDAE